MGFNIDLFRIKKARLEDLKITGQGLVVLQLPSEVKKELINIGLEDMILKVSGKHYIKLEPVCEWCSRFSPSFTQDWIKAEEINPGIHLGWDMVLHKTRLEEICEKYVDYDGEYPHLKEQFKNKIINNHQDGETILIRWQ